MSDEERPESLAAQAAAWVPPWERAPREPDRAFQEAAERAAREEQADDADRSVADLSDDDDDFDSAFEGDDPRGYEGVVDETAADSDASSDPNSRRGPDSSSDLDPDAGSDPSPDLGLDAESDLRSDASLDPSSDAGPNNSSDADPGPDARPNSISDGGSVGAEGGAVVDAPADDSAQGPTDVRVGPDLDVPEAVSDVADDGDGEAVDEPFADGDDAGDVFDAAADDDVSDDSEVDIPVDEDAVTSGDDEPAAVAVVPGQSSRARDSDDAVVESASRTSEDLPVLEDDAELAAALEAILLVVDEPVGEMHLAEILEQPTERVGEALEDISARYTAAGHGFDLRRVAGGWRLYTRPEYAAYVERFVLDGQSVRLTQAALETLAVVAYKQPVTRSRISAIRGVNCDGVMRTLATRGLIEEAGTEGETGAYLYRTTPLFLEKLGLNSIDQLPPLAPFLPDDVEEVLDAASG